jgi:histidinol-phosphatase
VYAGRGLGCYTNGAPARVNETATLAGAYLSTSGYGPWSDEALLRAKRAHIALRTWGDGYGYALVATGRIEAMYDPIAALYDLAPMPVIMHEAGGRFTDLSGQSGAAGGSGLATNGIVHDELLALLSPST